MFPWLKRSQPEDGQRGQSLAELALVLPIFLVLLFAIIDFGFGFHAWITVTNSAREGARLGTVGGPRDGSPDCNPLPAAGSIEKRVCDTASSLNQDAMSLTVSYPNGQASGNSVVVGVNYQYILITPLSGLLGLIGGGALGPTLTFSSTADMRLE